MRLLNGVDSLELGWEAPVPGEVIGKLAAAREHAKTRGEQKTEVELAGYRWVIDPWGKKPYAFALHREDMIDLYVAGARLPEKTPTVRMELRSPFLMTGWPDASATARRIARAILGAPERCRETVARLDLFCDFQGWAPDGSSDELRCFVRRTRRRITREGGEGDDFTGYVFGKGTHLVVRIYCKSVHVETVARNKRWMWALWESVEGYTAGAPVWRVEVQLRTDTLKELGARENFARVAAQLDGLWHYVIGSPDWHPEKETPESVALRAARAASKDGRHDPALLRRLEREVAAQSEEHGAWLSLRVPDDSTRTEWAIAPAWRELQEAVFANANAPRATRVAQRQTQIDNVRQQIAGLLSTLHALSGLEERDGGERWQRNAETIADACDVFQSLQLAADEGKARDFAARAREKTAGRDQVEEALRAAELLRDRLAGRPPEAPWQPMPRRSVLDEAQYRRLHGAPGLRDLVGPKQAPIVFPELPPYSAAEQAEHEAQERAYNEEARATLRALTRFAKQDKGAV